MSDPDTQSLRADQIRREIAERRRAGSSQDAAEARPHERRAERAAYLSEKLGERAASEERTAKEEG